MFGPPDTLELEVPKLVVTMVVVLFLGSLMIWFAAVARPVDSLRVRSRRIRRREVRECAQASWGA